MPNLAMPIRPTRPMQFGRHKYIVCWSTPDESKGVNSGLDLINCRSSFHYNFQAVLTIRSK